MVIYCRNVSLPLDAKLFWRPFLAPDAALPVGEKDGHRSPQMPVVGQAKKKQKWMENSGDLPLTLDLQSNAATCRGERDVVFRDRTAAYRDR